MIHKAITMEAILTQKTMDINSSLRKCLFSQDKRTDELNPRQVENFNKKIESILKEMVDSGITEVEAELKMSIALKGRAAELILNRSKYFSFSKKDKRKTYLSNLINLHLDIGNKLFEKHI